MKSLLGVLLIALAGAAQARCADDLVTVKGDFGQARFQVDLADEPAEHRQGLMFVEQMGTLEGMLFVYDTPRHATFWMQNTLIPLDMLFVAPDGTITRIHPDAIPLDETIIDGGTGVQAVLEINGGLAARLGIAEGDILQHPTFGANAVLPCE